MGYYYKFYRPRDMKIIEEGKFSGMPFYWVSCRVKFQCLWEVMI